MNESVKLKDYLYYDDLIYEIKSLGGFMLQEDELIQNRIWKREDMNKELQEDGRVLYTLSLFQEEVFEIVSGISRKVNKPFRNLYEIAKYPELVQEVLIELEKKKELNNKLLEIVPSNYISKDLNNSSFTVTSELEEKLLREKMTLKVIEMNNEVGESKENSKEEPNHKLIREDNVKEENRGISVNFAEKYAHLICKDIPKLQLKSYPYGISLPKEYRREFIHTEDGFAYLFCMSEEEQEEVRKTRKKTLTSDNN